MVIQHVKLANANGLIATAKFCFFVLFSVSQARVLRQHTAGQLRLAWRHWNREVHVQSKVQAEKQDEALLSRLRTAEKVGWFRVKLEYIS